jgi:hypothetical protein
MSWFSSCKLPVTEDERNWVDGAFRRLERLLGRDRMINAKMILPSDYYFPDAYDRKPAAADALFRRLCGYMDVDSAAIKLEVFQDETEELRNLLPHWSSPGNRCAAGFYWRGLKENQQGAIPSRW